MVDEKCIILMNQEIDGENTQAESTELKTYLQNHPEAEQVFNSLKEVSRSMDALEAVDPPHYLKTRILNQIDSKRYQPKESFSLSALLESIKGFRFTWRFAVSFAGGAAAGILLLILLNTVSDQDMQFQNWQMFRGTIVPEALLDPAYMIDSISVDQESVSGEVSVRYIDSTLVFHMDFVTDGLVKIEFNLEEPVYEFLGMRISETESPPNLLVDSGRFEFNQQGRQSLYLFFDCDHSANTAIQFVISNDETVQIVKTIQVVIPPTG